MMQPCIPLHKQLIAAEMSTRIDFSFRFFDSAFTVLFFCFSLLYCNGCSSFLVRFSLMRGQLFTDKRDR